MHKDISILAREVKKQGWEVAPTKNNHLMFISPKGERIYTGSTPQDVRSVRNLRAQLRQKGFQDHHNKKKNGETTMETTAAAAEPARPQRTLIKGAPWLPQSVGSRPAKVLGVLGGLGEPIKTKDLINMMDLPANSINPALHRLTKDKFITKHIITEGLRKLALWSISDLGRRVLEGLVRGTVKVSTHAISKKPRKSRTSNKVEAPVGAYCLTWTDAKGDNTDYFKDQEHALAFLQELANEEGNSSFRLWQELSIKLKTTVVVELG
jgi:hypothetical protein